MRAKPLFLLVLAFAVLSPFFASAQTEANQGATVYLLRRSGYNGSMSSYPVFMDGKRLCEVSNRRYSVHQVFPGTHRFSVRFGGKHEKESADQLELNLEAGKAYYIKLDQRNGFGSSIRLEELTATSGKAFMEDLKEETDCK